MAAGSKISGQGYGSLARVSGRAEECPPGGNVPVNHESQDSSEAVLLRLRLVLRRSLQPPHRPDLHARHAAHLDLLQGRADAAEESRAGAHGQVCRRHQVLVRVGRDAREDGQERGQELPAGGCEQGDEVSSDVVCRSDIFEGALPSQLCNPARKDRFGPDGKVLFQERSSEVRAIRGEVEADRMTSMISCGDVRHTGCQGRPAEDARRGGSWDRSVRQTRFPRRTPKAAHLARPESINSLVQAEEAGQLRDPAENESFIPQSAATAGAQRTSAIVMLALSESSSGGTARELERRASVLAAG